MSVSLQQYVGTTIADELERCGNRRGWTARVPARPWSASDGYTDATVAALVLDGAHDAEKIVLKSVPSFPLERDPYTEANDRCPGSFRAHLVLAAQAPWRTRSGGALIFQKLAADDVEGCRSLATFAPAELSRACAAVVNQIIRQWNEEVQRPQPWPVPQLLRCEIGPDLASAGSLRSWTERFRIGLDSEWWVTFPDDSRVYPNPLMLARADSPLGSHEADVQVGQRHGDLHLLNVLVPTPPHGEPALEDFQLIDLDSYTRTGPLTSDPVMLLLSALAHGLCDVPPHRWDDVMQFVVSPTAAPPAGPLFDLVAAVHGASLTAINDRGKGWSGDWRHQFQLSSLATAAYFTTFTNLGPKRRWWFFRLAAHLGLAVLTRLGVALPSSGRPVQNPFRSLPHRRADLADGGPVLVPQVPLDPAGRLVARAWRRAPAERAAARKLLMDTYDEIRTTGAGDAAAPVATTNRVRDVLRDAELILGADDPTVLLFQHELAGWTRRSGDAREAVRLFLETAHHRTEVLGSRHPDTMASRAAARDPELIREAARQRERDWAAENPDGEGRLGSGPTDAAP